MNFVMRDRIMEKLTNKEEIGIRDLSIIELALTMYETYDILLNTALDLDKGENKEVFNLKCKGWNHRI